MSSAERVDTRTLPQLAHLYSTRLDGAMLRRADALNDSSLAAPFSTT